MALFDRAEARDFADVFELSQHFSKNDLLEEASEVDRGFDRHLFAQMLRSLARFSDADLPAPEALIAAMRDFFATWADQLDTSFGSSYGARLVPAYWSESVDICKHPPVLNLLLLLMIGSRSSTSNRSLSNQRVGGSSPSRRTKVRVTGLQGGGLPYRKAATHVFPHFGLVGTS